MQFSPLCSAPQVHPSLEYLPRLTDQVALFLDFDGTLVDIAPQPELVDVPSDLVRILSQLSEQLGGALAIVSGRSLHELDLFLAPLVLPVAAEHGAVQRLPGGLEVHAKPPDLYEISKVALALTAQHTKLRVEIKSASVALHYRQAPELAMHCLDVLEEAIQHSVGLELLKGKCVFEIKMMGVSKGMAIHTFMTQTPFQGRPPVFAGDDTTDEAGFIAVKALGGQGIKVGEGISMADLRCPNPTSLREWLRCGFASVGGVAEDAGVEGVRNDAH